MKDVHETEKYATIDGFPDYLVTSNGRVFSLKYGKFKELKQEKTKSGYLFVRLCKNNEKFHKYVHRLVAQAFITNYENKKEINHIDENKTNNHASNLEWVTHKENINHGTHLERMRKAKCKKIIAKSLTQSRVMVFKSTIQVKKFGFEQSEVSRCCNGKRKCYKGYTWQFIDKDKNK